jgi:hypothetical protein
VNVLYLLWLGEERKKKLLQKIINIYVLICTSKFITDVGLHL